MLSDGFINKLNCGNHNICVCQIITLYTLSSYNNAFFSFFFTIQKSPTIASEVTHWLNVSQVVHWQPQVLHS